MDLDDIFTARLKLLIIMAKAYLKGCVQGKRRVRAMLENAHHVELESIDLCGFTDCHKGTELIGSEHAFYKRVQLLAVIIKVIARGFPIEAHRRTTLQENVDIICEALSLDNDKPEKQLSLIKAV
jgi:hypothetical protein